MGRRKTMVVSLLAPIRPGGRTPPSPVRRRPSNGLGEGTESGRVVLDPIACCAEVAAEVNLNSSRARASRSEGRTPSNGR